MPELMQAVLKASPTVGFSVAEVPVPAPGPDEVLLRVSAASVCGTDVHLFDWNPWAAARVRPPRVMGHEICGEVVQLGSGVADVVLGSRVAVESHIVCGQCAECQRGDFHVCANTQIIGVDVDGGFASYVAIPARNAIAVDSDVPADMAAAMEPFGNAVHACSNGDLRGASVAVFGCGPIGCASVAVAKAKGAATVIAVDRTRYRLDLAQRMGADITVTAGDIPADEAVLRAAGGKVDCALEMSGAASAVVGACRVVRPGGWVSLLGLGDAPVTIDLASDVIDKGIALYGVIGRRIPQTWDEVRGYIREGAIDVGALITHHMAIDQINEAIALMKSGNCGKVSLHL